MADEFDPYEKWLGIPPRDQPPNHYQLLGLRIGEDNPQVIADAAQWKVVIVGTFQSSPHREHVPRLLAEIEAARTCLLDQAARAAHDASLGVGAKSRLRTLFPAWLVRDALFVAGGLFGPVLAASLFMWLLAEVRPVADDVGDSADAACEEQAPATRDPIPPTAPAAASLPASDSFRPLDIAPVAEAILGSSTEEDSPRDPDAETSWGSSFGLEGLLVNWQRRLLANREAPEPPEVTRARSVLARNPHDPESQATLGKYECFVADDWDAGLQRLASCNDAELIELARQEASQPDAIVQMLALADAWYAWGRQSVGGERQGAFFRSLTWFRRAGPGMSAADTGRIEPRLAEMTAALADAQSGPPCPVPWLDGPPGQVRVLEGHAGNVTVMAVAPSGVRLVSAAADRTVRMWNLLTGDQIWKQATQTGNLTGLVITPDLQFVISNFDDRHFIEMRAADGRVRRYVGDSPGPPAGLCLTREGLLLWAARGTPHDLVVWDLAQNRRVARRGGGDGLHVLDMSQDGQQVVTCDARGEMQILDRRTGASLWKAAAHQAPIIAVDLSADGRHVATATEREVRLWEIPSPEPLHTFSVETVRTIALSLDGRRLACGAGQELLLWDVRTGQRRGLPPAAASSAGVQVTCLAFLPDSRGLATGAAGGEIALWRLAD